MPPTRAEGEFAAGPAAERTDRGAGTPLDLAAARVLLLGSLVVAPLLLGSISVWAHSLLAIILAVALGLVLGAHLYRPCLDRVPRAPLGCLLLLAAGGVAQLVPLPASLLASLSPARLELDRALTPDPAILARAPESAARGALDPDRKVPLSAAPDVTRDAVQCLLLYGAALVVSAATLRHRSDFRVLAWTLVGAGLLLAFLGMVRMPNTSVDLVHLIWRYPTRYATYVNRNHFAGFLELVVPFAVTLLLVAWLRLRRESGIVLLELALAGGALLLLGAALIDCGSRGGLVGTLCGIGLLGALVLRHPRGRGPARVLVTVAGLGLVAFLLIDRGNAFRHLTGTRLGEGSVQLRQEVWKGSLRLFRAYPLTGAGLGAFPDVFPRYKPVPSGVFFEHPESDYLWCLGERGLVFLLPGVALVLLGLGVFARRLHVLERGHMGSEEGAERWLWWAAAAAGLSSLLVHGLLDVNLHVPANALAGSVLLSLYFGDLRRGRERAAEREAWRRAVGLGGIAVLVAAAGVYLARKCAADWLLTWARGGMRELQPVPRSRPVVEAVLALDPGRPGPRFVLGRLEADRALDLGEVVQRRRQGAERAFAELALASRRRPAEAVGVFELGWLAARWGLEGEAPSSPLATWGEGLMEHAIELDPGYAPLRARLGLHVAFSGPGRLQEGLARVREGLALDAGSQDAILRILASRLPPVMVAKAVPELPENRFRYALSLLGEGQERAGILQLARASQMARARPDLGLDVRRRMAEAVEPRLAVVLWERIVEDSEGQPADLGKLGMALAALGEHGRALEVLRLAAARQPTPNLKLALAQAALRLGECAEAAESARAVLAARTSDVGALLVVARCQERAGELGSAHATLSRILAIRPGDAGIRDDLHRVERAMATTLVGTGTQDGVP